MYTVQTSYLYYDTCGTLIVYMRYDIISALLRCKDLNSAGARGIVRVWWETHQTIECRLIIKSSKCETNASSGRLSIELRQVMIEQIM